jgi:RNA polymerase sigma-B factor
MNDLSKRRETELFKELRGTGDPTIRETLVRRYLPLARHTARRFQRNGDAFEDLFQVACFALLKAIDKFDPDRGLAFSSYAVPSMSGELKRHARDTGWGMRVPRGLQERVLKVDQAITRLTASDGHSPSPARIAQEVGLTSEEVLEAIEAGANHSLESLDKPMSSGDPDSPMGARVDILGNEDPGYDLVDDVQTLAPAIRALPKRERALLALRFGEELSQSEIARHLGISQMHVSRLLRRTLDGLAERVDDQALAR